MPDVVLFAAAAAKLIDLGISGGKAMLADGAGFEEAKAFQSVLDTLPVLSKLVEKKPREHGQLSAYCELLTLAFGKAWRRHWAEDERLAPEQGSAKWRAWFHPKSKQQRLKQLEAALADARLEQAVLGNMSQEEELELLSSLQDPIRSPWYAALWAAFNRAAEPAPKPDGSSEIPPLLLFEHGGKDKLKFERHVRLAFREGLADERGQRLHAWLQGHAKDKGELLRELLAARLSAFRSDHVFGNGAQVAGVAYLPLEGLYVEPKVHVLSEAEAGPLDESPPERILTKLHQLLADTKTRIILVLADFGHGKSLTARSLAAELAGKFLDDVSQRSTDVAYPIFASCPQALRQRHLDDINRVVSIAQKSLADSFWRDADGDDPALGLPADQACVGILDGLDEVQLSTTETKEFFESLERKANARRRFVVFSRPGAVPDAVRSMPTVQVLELLKFDRKDIESWLCRWGRLSAGPSPALAQLAERGLATLCEIPVLLFMVTQSWAQLHTQRNVRRCDVYEAFVKLMARGKLEHDGRFHPAVKAAAEIVRSSLVERGELAAAATEVDAMLNLLARVAWKIYGLEQQNKPCQLRDITRLLESLDLPPEAHELVSRAVVLTLSTTLGDQQRELRFTHRSFQEFLVAFYWQSQLLRIMAAGREGEQFERELWGANLIGRDDASFEFLTELCQRWSEPQRAELGKWATFTFNCEDLSVPVLRDDRRYKLRHTALAIGSIICGGIRARDSGSLASLLAMSAVHTNELPRLVAEHFASPGAQLVEGNLSGAILNDADLSGANLDQARLRGAWLARAQLVRARLSSAQLSQAHMDSANLSGADLSYAVLIGAKLVGTDLRGANLTGARLTGADLRGANLRNAIVGSPLERKVTFRDARVDSSTIFPNSFDPELAAELRANSRRFA